MHILHAIYLQFRSFEMRYTGWHINQTSAILLLIMLADYQKLSTPDSAVIFYHYRWLHIGNLSIDQLMKYLATFWLTVAKLADNPAFAPSCTCFVTKLDSKSHKSKESMQTYKSVFSFLRRCKHDTARICCYRRAAVDIGRKATTPAADAQCSNRSISPARGAHSSKPPRLLRKMGLTDRRTDTVLLHMRTVSINQKKTSISHDASRWLRQNIVMSRWLRRRAKSYDSTTVFLQRLRCNPVALAIVTSQWNGCVELLSGRKYGTWQLRNDTNIMLFLRS